MPQVQRIDPIVLPSEKESVAAYCRVSTDSADQLNSYHSQIAYYTKLINENPDWELYDIYADAGITGTSIDKRDEFKRMIADCREEKIKRVLVKSVSRFARNTTELLETTRELKDLGVVVVFEEQGFDTSQALGEMQLTMYAMAAQEESLSTSRNIQWSYQKRMQNGTFITNTPPYGYELREGALIQKPEEICVVRDIFRMYLSGIGMQKIAESLNNQGVHARYNTRWFCSTVRHVLTNERHTGNALLQKYYTVDSLSHTRKPNKGQRQQFYITNSHDGAISQREFQIAQQLMQMRNRNSSRDIHLFTHRILCPDCHHHFRQTVCSGKAYWECPHRVKGLSHCTPYRLYERDIVLSSLNLMAKIYLSSTEIITPILSPLREIEYTQSGSDTKLSELDMTIATLNERALTLQKLNTKGFISPEEYRLQSEALAAQRQRLTAERNKKLHGLQSHSAIEKLEELQAILSSWPGVPTEFDIDQFDEVVEKIIPTADNKLTFRLRCGLELTEEIPS